MSLRVTPEWLDAREKRLKRLTIEGRVAQHKAAKGLRQDQPLETVRIPKGRIGPSKIEERFVQQLALAGYLPRQSFQSPYAFKGYYERNCRFLDGRDLELDFAWPLLRVGVEVQGMAHRIKAKFRADMEKRALALLAGWRVLEIGGAEVRSGIGVKWASRVIEDAKRRAHPEFGVCDTECA